jgi:hypothetical protein
MYLGPGDNHNVAFNDKEHVVPFYDEKELDNLEKSSGDYCLYSFHIYPTNEFNDTYESTLPVVLTIVVAGAFVLMLATFVIYDIFVSRRNKKVNLVVSRLRSSC